MQVQWIVFEEWAGFCTNRLWQPASGAPAAEMKARLQHKEGKEAHKPSVKEERQSGRESREGRNDRAEMKREKAEKWVWREVWG